MAPPRRLWTMILVTTAFLVFYGFRDKIGKLFDDRQQYNKFSTDVLDQDRIKRQLEVFYRAIDSDFTPPSEWLSVKHDQTYYLPNKNIIFTGIPKVGCSNWKEQLLEAEGALKKPIQQEKVKSVHGPATKFRMSHFDRYDGQYDERIRNATSILILRNPWVRAVSGFRQKLSSEKTQGGSYPKMGLKVVKDQRNISDDVQSGELFPTFKEFLTYSVARGGIGDVHFKPQHKFIFPDRVRYDYVIPLEEAGPMSRVLFEKLELKGNSDLFGSYDHQSDPRLQSSVLKAKEWLTEMEPELVNKFYELYKYDFMLLNYTTFSDPDFPMPRYNT